MNLTTADRVKTLIGSRGDLPEETRTELEAVIATVSGAVEVYLDRLLLRVARTEYHDVDAGQTRFRLRAYPVTAVASVAYDTEQAWTTTLEATSDYLSPVYSGAGVLVVRYELSPVADAPGSLKVVYTGGMGTDTDAFIDAYPDIAGAVDIQAAHEWQRRGALGVSSLNYPDGTTASMTAERWVPAVKQVLDHHARR